MRVTSFKTASLIAFIGCLLKAVMAIICLLINISPTISYDNRYSIYVPDRIFLYFTLYKNKLENKRKIINRHFA